LKVSNLWAEITSKSNLEENVLSRLGAIRDRVMNVMEIVNTVQCKLRMRLNAAIAISLVQFCNDSKAIQFMLRSLIESMEVIAIQLI
jgi:hypothetical protein